MHFWMQELAMVFGNGSVGTFFFHLYYEQEGGEEFMYRGHLICRVYLLVVTCRFVFAREFGSSGVREAGKEEKGTVWF